MIHFVYDRVGKIVSFRRALPARFIRLAALLTLVTVGFAAPLEAGENANPSGYPLPRFASLRSEPVNVRKGPGVRYEVAWVYVRARLPVEIIQEFDIWRKIRDSDGQEGWIQQNLLSGNRTGYIAPWSPDIRVPLRASNSKTAPVRAWLTSRYLIKIKRCDGSFCEVSASGKSGSGRRDYSGFVKQSQIWGVYPNETVK